MPRFDPNRVQVRWGSDLVTGFASGTFIDVQYTTPEESTPQVNFGTLIEVVSTDRSGTVTCTLKPDSPFLRVYQQRANAANAPGANLQKPLVIVDLNGGDVATLSKARIVSRMAHTYDTGTGPNAKPVVFRGETLVTTTNGISND